jgi:hypothetical protein
MPKGTKVHDMFSAMVREGMSKGKAARIAQAKTGLALQTGKPPKSKEKFASALKRKRRRKKQ